MTSRPNFLIAGAARSGTTALSVMLAQHPAVFVTDPKEVHFFAFAGTPPAFTGPGDDETINRVSVTDPGRFLQLFNEGAECAARGEGSVSTLYYGDTAIPNIKRHADPDVQLFIVLREPADRALSSFLYLRSRGYEPEAEFSDALGLEDERVEAGYHHMWHLRRMSRYAEQLPGFLDAFGDRVHLMIHEEFVEDPGEHLRAMADNLGIDASFAFSTDRSVNRGGEPRSENVAKVLRTLRGQALVRKSIRALVPSAARERVRESTLRAPDVPLETMRTLRAEFAADRAFVRDVLGRDVPSWTK